MTVKFGSLYDLGNLKKRQTICQGDNLLWNINERVQKQTFEFNH